MRMRCWRGLWLGAMLCVSTLGAAGNDAPLADAVQRRDQQAVQSLLKKRADVNAPQSDGATALHWAAYLEDADTTALLIRAGAKVDTPQQLRCDAAGAGLRKRQRRGHRSALEGRSGSERRCARRRDSADARGAHRTSRCGEGAAERRREGRRQGDLERTDGADVGGCRGARDRSCRC